MKKTYLFFTVLLLSVLFVRGELTPVPGNQVSKQTSLEVKTGINFAKVPLHFIANKGQVNKQAAFYAKASRYTLWITQSGLVFDSVNVNTNSHKGPKREVSKMTFPGANPRPVILPLGKNRHKVNYFKGRDRSKWVTDIPASNTVLYKNLYRGIDLKVYGIEQEVEYDWIVKSGGNPADIRFEYENVQDTNVDAEGNLVIMTRFGELVHKKPFSFQVIDGKQAPVDVVFKKTGKNEFGFDTGAYDKSLELVIDPAVLVYSTYIGGTTNSEYVKAFYTDGEGLVYLTGATTATDFPTTTGAFDTSYATGGNYDAYISVIDTTESGGNSLVYSTYMGDDGSATGNGVDAGQDITVDSNGIIYVAGCSSDSKPNFFPVTDSSEPKGSYDLFVVKLDPSESGDDQLLLSTLKGGSSSEWAKAIAFDSSGNIYIAGYTQSRHYHANPFPLSSNAYQTVLAGATDFFVMELSSAGVINYSSYIGGGSNGDESTSDFICLGLDTSNNVYIAGRVSSNNYPLKGTTLKSTRQYDEGFISIFDTSASTASDTLLYSTYFGGTKADEISNIFMDGDDIYITGKTMSNSSTQAFPITTGAYQSSHGGGYDAFITKLDYSPSLNQMTVDFSTYLGGSGEDWGRSIAVDSSGYVYVGGRTKSSNFPVDNSYQSCSSSVLHGFGAILDITAGTSGLVFSTCLGGSSTDSAILAGWDASGNFVTAGATLSTNFPVTSSALQSTRKGSSDMFVTVLDY
jgi:hypothetical protein